MSNEMKKGELFIKQVIAKLKGDDAEVKAAKISRKALSAMEGQLAALKAKLVDNEDTVDTAKENLDAAIYPTELITDNQRYCQNIVNAQIRLAEEEEDLESVKTQIKNFENLIKTKF